MEDKLLKLNASVCILRLCAVISKNSKYNWLSDLRNNIKKKENINFYNLNHNYNNCISENELFSLIKKIIKVFENKKEIYNVSSNESIKIKEIYNFIKKKKISSKINVYKNNSVDFFNDSSKIQRELNIKFNSTKKNIFKFLN